MGGRGGIGAGFGVVATDDVVVVVIGCGGAVVKESGNLVRFAVLSISSATSSVWKKVNMIIMRKKIKKISNVFLYYYSLILCV